MTMNIESDTNNLSVKNQNKENIKIYAAAGIGAFFLGLGDLSKKDNVGAVDNIAEGLQRIAFFSNIQEPPIGIALLLLVILGVLACWVNRPTERIQGFMTGFSVFALLTVGVPQSEIQATSQIPTTTAGGGTEAIFAIPSTPVPASYPSPLLPISESSALSFFISSASAHGHLSEKQSLGKGSVKSAQLLAKELGSVTIILNDNKGQRLKNTETFIVTLVNKTNDDRKKYRFSGTEFTLTDVAGNYKLFIEIEDYRNTHTYFSIKDPLTTIYTLTLDSSSIPVGLQKLVSSEKKDLRYAAFETDRLRGINLFKMGEYEKAIQYYNKILKAEPNHADIVNYKGYALYRWGKYQEAENILSKGIKKYPNNILIRLNLAKNSCKFDKITKADDILFKQFSLSSPQKQLVCNDQEFIKACSTLTQYCSTN